MKCHYEVLGLARDADKSEIKKSYRKLALKWHPDKNLNDSEVAKEQFQLVQQAYEVLSDPQERTWYDNHREQILRGKNSNYEDNCLDVFQYFTTTCFKGFGDDPSGFYAVYGEVFNQIASEDVEFLNDIEYLEIIPKFGDSESDYDRVVGPFYAYWQSYCTKRSYAWLCKYDITEIKDRRVLREVEKDTKKIAQKARKERNEEVRNLVSFVRKRDKRVQAYRLHLEEKAEANRKKQEQLRVEQIRKRNKEMEEMCESHGAHSLKPDGYEEQLRLLEQEYSDTHSEASNSDSENNSVEQDEAKLAGDYYDDLYCVACNKTYKNENAYINHEYSQKHIANVEKLKIQMHFEEIVLSSSESPIDLSNDNKDNVDILVENFDNIDIIEYDPEEDEETEETEETELKINSKKKNKKNKKSTAKGLKENDLKKTDDEFPDLLAHLKEEIEDWTDLGKKPVKKTSKKNGNKKTEETKTKEKNIEIPQPTETLPINTSINEINTRVVCVTCKSVFESKNKLFKHLKGTNHGTYLPKTGNAQSRKKKAK